MPNYQGELTPKMLHFSRNIASGLKPVDAYLEAYSWKGSRKSAGVEACKLKADPRVAQKIEQLLRQRDQAAVVQGLKDRELVLSKLRQWTSGMDQEGNPVKPPSPTTVRAAELLGKSKGIFVDVQEEKKARSPEEIKKELLDLLQETGLLQDDAQDDDQDDAQDDDQDFDVPGHVPTQ